MVGLPSALIYAPIRDQSGSNLTTIEVDLPVITGFKTGGLPILSYSLQTSPNLTTWISLCGYGQNYE